MGAWLLGAARGVLGWALKWGTIGSVAGGVGTTVMNGQDLNGQNIGANTANAAVGITSFAGNLAKGFIAPPSPQPTPQNRTGSSASSQGANSQYDDSGAGGQNNFSSKLMGIFNNFSDTKFGQALAPVMGFLRSSPIISGILTLVFGMMALSGQNSMPMRIFAGGMAGVLAKESGIFDSVTQGFGRNTPAVGGADSVYQSPRAQPHTGGPAAGGRGYDLDDPTLRGPAYAPG